LIPWVNSRGGKIGKSRLPQVFSTKWNQILKRLAICGEGHPDPKAPVNRYQQSPLPPETFPIEAPGEKHSAGTWLLCQRKQTKSQERLCPSRP
jgi:hypothetical protein